MTGIAALCACAAATAPETAPAIPPPNDPLYPQQVGPGTDLATIGYPQALSDLGATPLAEVPVAALDTGVDLTHPDLAPRLITFGSPQLVSPFPGDGSDNGGTAPAGAHGWNFLGTWPSDDYADAYNSPGNADPSDPKGPEGSSGHGTSVTGLMAAASGNGIGGAGIAPNARILAIRSCWDADQCPGYVQPQAIQFAAQQGARVVTMSWNMDQADFDGPPGNDAGTPKAAIEAAPNTLFVALAGAGNPSAYPDQTARPCGLSASEPNVICVTGSSSAGAPECGQYDPAIVDLAVPLDGNQTTLNGGGFGQTFCATSFASPTLGGAAAVLFGLDPSATPADVIAALEDSARRTPAWAGLTKTGGVLDLDAALKLFAQRRHVALVPDPAPQPSAGGGASAPAGSPAAPGAGGPSPLPVATLNGPPAPRCTLTVASVRVTLARRRGSRTRPGTVALRVRCDRAATAVLSGGFLDTRARRTYPLAPLRLRLAAGVRVSVLAALPRGALRALSLRAARERASFELTATSRAGARAVTSAGPVSLLLRR